MIAELRAQLASDLAVLDVPVHVAWPDRVTVPCVALVPPSAASYVTGGPTFGGAYTVGVDVLVLVGKPSAVTLEALDSLVEGVLANSADWELSGVDSPSTVSINGADVLGTIVHLSKPARL